MSRLLVVEDQADIRRLILMTLELENHEIREAGSGEQGLASARDWQPDLVLLDVMMPGALNGLDVCAALRAEPALARIPVVLLSARAQAVDRDAGLRAGANAYLVKPFSPLALLSTVEQLLSDPTRVLE